MNITYKKLYIQTTTALWSDKVISHSMFLKVFICLRIYGLDFNIKINLKSLFYGIFEEQITQKGKLYFNNAVKLKLSWEKNHH